MTVLSIGVDDGGYGRLHIAATAAPGAGAAHSAADWKKNRNRHSR